MKLTDTQVATFEDEGYLFLPGLFSAAEVGVLNDAAAEIYASDREEVWRKLGRGAHRFCRPHL